MLVARAKRFSGWKTGDNIGSEITYQLAELKDQERCVRQTRSGSAAK